MIGRFAIGLGAVKRQIGVLHQRHSVLAIPGSHGDAEACAAFGLLIVDHDRSFETGDDAFGQRRQARGFGRNRQHENEFVAAEPGDHGLGQAGRHVIGDIAQQAVPRGMAQGVVDQLEIVEIDIGDHHPVAVLHPQQRLIELFEEELAVGQAGEVVMEPDMHDLALALLDRGDHHIEAGGEPADLVLGAGCQFDIAALGDQPGGLVELLQRPGDRARDAPTQPHDQQDSTECQRSDEVLQR